MTSPDKPASFLPHRDSDCNFGKGLRGRNKSNNDPGIFKVDGDFGSRDQRNATGVISINVDNITISDCGKFIDIVKHMAKEKFGVGAREENEATYLCIAIRKCKTKFQNDRN